MATFDSPPRVAVLATDTTIYTATSDNTIVMSSIVPNLDGVNTTDLDCWWVDASNANAIGYFCKALPVPPKAAYEPIPAKFVLMNGDSIHAQASAAGDLEFSLSISVL